MELTLQAPAKINLTLDVTGRREDGYHLIQSVMQTVTLTDEVTVRLEDGLSGIRLQVSDAAVPADDRNTAWRAAAAFLGAVDTPYAGAAVTIRKNIPMEAGLAGGSADAAAVLAALNRLTDARLTVEELCDLGGKIGADVPFCLLGGAAEATGTGTILSPLPSLPPCWLVLAKPCAGVSTAEAYRLVDKADIRRRPNHAAVADALLEGDLETVGRELGNVFEYAVSLPEVERLKQTMRRFDTLGCQMTGSGSAVFGLFSDKAEARRCAQALRDLCGKAVVCRPCPTGPYEGQKILENLF